MYPDFPKAGINFLLIFSPFLKIRLLSMTKLGNASRRTVRYTIDAIIGLESRGFIFGILLSTLFKVPFVPIRKAGKLPGECIKGSYNLEYGSATLEIQKSALKAGSHVVLIDDVLAIGGTMSAAVKLCKAASLNILGAGMLLEVADCNGGERLDELVLLKVVFTLLSAK
ncbi:unnamed protein product [Taenia asiatica]|uniref:adenine phosphoribosyltransferase n=1 Tax=Taenia asiatica TaxID=60517 RepID=A0A158R8Z1_TAEAS|nr:unnamed protein product [Taenia asiatica]